MSKAHILVVVTLITLAALLCACGAGSEGRFVVIYTAVDQHFSEPILDRFEVQTGIEVRPVFDVEAAKATGLVNRLIAEKDRPQADVWWNVEFAQTITLAEQGVLQPYRSPSAGDIPAHYVDPDRYWTAFGGRARVILVNTEILSPSEYPDSIYDLLDSSVAPDQIALAYPMFGTTATHAAALYAELGTEEARAYYQALKDRGIRIVDGNSVVRDQVAGGQLAFGMTDTDDACGAIERGAPVAIVFPDQGEGELGTLVIPNTVALVAGAPHPNEGKALIDFLLSTEVEAGLIESGWFHVALRPLDVAPGCVDATDVRGMSVSLREIAGEIEPAKTELGDIFVR